MKPRAPYTRLAAMIAVSGASTSAQTEPERLISLAPHTTEYVFFLGAEDRLVGAVEYSDYPEAAKKIPRVGGYQTLSLEKIASLSPTLVLIWPSGNPANVYQALKERRIPLFESEPHAVADIATELRRLATTLSLPASPTEKVDQFEREIATLRKTYAERPTVSVFYQVWEKPLYTLGGTHFVNDLLAICGGRNIYADVKEPAPIVAFESLLARKPQVILSSAKHGSKALDSWRQDWQQWQQIPAVKNVQMHYVDADIFTRPTPRALDAAKILCEHLEEARRVGDR